MKEVKQTMEEEKEGRKERKVENERMKEVKQSMMEEEKKEVKNERRNERGKLRKE